MKGDDEEQAEIRHQFETLDKDGSGYVSKEEMITLIAKCKFLKGDVQKEAEKCINELDVDGDGKVSYPEFMLAWKFG